MIIDRPVSAVLWSAVTCHRFPFQLRMPDFRCSKFRLSASAVSSGGSSGYVFPRSGFTILPTLNRRTLSLPISNVPTCKRANASTRCPHSLQPSCRSGGSISWYQIALMVTKRQYNVSFGDDLIARLDRAASHYAGRAVTAWPLR